MGDYRAELPSSTTAEYELAELELGAVAALWLVASPYDTPQFDDGFMYWERAGSTDA